MKKGDLLLYEYKGFLKGWRPWGWNDMGKVKRRRVIEEGKEIIKIPLHRVCNDPLYVGQDEVGKLFRFCRRCKVVVELF